jgi:hypothetical protein
VDNFVDFFFVFIRNLHSCLLEDVLKMPKITSHNNRLNMLNGSQLRWFINLYFVLAMSQRLNTSSRAPRSQAKWVA